MRVNGCWDGLQPVNRNLRPDKPHQWILTLNTSSTCLPSETASWGHWGCAVPLNGGGVRREHLWPWNHDLFFIKRGPRKKNNLAFKNHELNLVEVFCWYVQTQMTWSTWYIHIYIYIFLYIYIYIYIWPGACHVWLSPYPCCHELACWRLPNLQKFGPESLCSWGHRIH